MSLAEVLEPAAGSGPPRLQWSTRPSTADQRQRRAVQHLHLDPQAVPAARQGAEGRQRVPQPRPRRHLRPARGARACGRSTTAASPASWRRTGSQAPAERPHRPAGADGLMTRDDLARLPSAHPAPAHPRRLPRARRLRHAAVLQRRLDGRRGAQHPRALRPRVDDAGAGAAPLTSRPRTSRSPTAPSTSATRRRASRCQRPALRHVRRGAGVPDRPAARVHPAGRGRRRRGVRRQLRHPRTSGRGRARHRGRQHHQPHRRRQGRQRRRVHARPSSRPAARASCVPGRGFLLNNELTDFTAVYDPADPNRIEPGKRPRSSMSPTIVLQNEQAAARARLARRLDDHHHGAQILVNRLDRGHDAAAGDRGAARGAVATRTR